MQLHAPTGRQALQRQAQQRLAGGSLFDQLALAVGGIFDQAGSSQLVLPQRYLAEAGPLGPEHAIQVGDAHAATPEGLRNCQRMQARVDTGLPQRQHERLLIQIEFAHALIGAVVAEHTIGHLADGALVVAQ